MFAALHESAPGTARTLPRSAANGSFYQRKSGLCRPSPVLGLSGLKPVARHSPRNTSVAIDAASPAVALAIAPQSGEDLRAVRRGGPFPST